MVEVITNPKSKRKVAVDGQTAKKLYQDFLKGDVTTLLEEDVKKLIVVWGKKLGLPKNSETLKKKIAITEENASNSPPPQQKTQSVIKKLSDFSNIKTISTQGTSKIYTGSLGGHTYFIKEVVKYVPEKSRVNKYGVYDIQLAVNELIASLIYRDVYKVDAIELFLVVNDVPNSPLQKYVLASKKIDIDTCEPITQDCQDLLENKIPGALEPFLVDCILANWDVGSRGNVGIVLSRKTKKAFRIDVGGGILYRALGAPRTEFGPIPSEHKQFFIPSNKGYKLFKKLTKTQLKDMYNILKKVQDSHFDTIISNIKKELSILNIPKDDIVRVKKVLSAISIIKQRHDWYLENESQVVSFLESKVL